MRLFLPLAILAFFALGCAGGSSPYSQPASSSPTPSGSGRIVANMAVKDPKARYLGEALAYISNMLDTDRTMAQAFVDDDRTPKSIVAALQKAHQSEDMDWNRIEAAPRAYADIAHRLTKIHDGHNAAYVQYAKTFSENTKTGMAARIDKADAILKSSLYEMNSLKDVISAAMERDVNR